MLRKNQTRSISKKLICRVLTDFFTIFSLAIKDKTIYRHKEKGNKKIQMNLLLKVFSHSTCTVVIFLIWFRTISFCFFVVVSPVTKLLVMQLRVATLLPQNCLLVMLQKYLCLYSFHTGVLDVPWPYFTLILRSI